MSFVQALQAVLIAIVLVGWIAYLVPMVVNRRRSQEVTDDKHEDFPDTMSVVSRGSCTLGSEAFMGGSCPTADDDNVGVIGADGAGDGACYY